jgi:hypothetical protein
MPTNPNGTASALVSRSGHLRVKSRRGGDMTSLLPELTGLPDRLAVELVAFGDDGLPSFPRLCERMLHGKRRIDVMLIILPCSPLEGRDITPRPYWERRQLLENLGLEGDYWSTTPSHRWRSSLGEGLRTGPRGRRRQETQRALPPRPPQLDQDQEPRLLALPIRGGSRAATDRDSTALGAANRPLLACGRVVAYPPLLPSALHCCQDHAAEAVGDDERKRCGDDEQERCDIPHPAAIPWWFHNDSWL